MYCHSLILQNYRIVCGVIVACALVPFSLFPTPTYAALNAGVVNGVWFSTPTPQAGEPVRIFAAVQNTSGERVSGTVAFLVNEEIVGTATFTADNNEVLSVSIPYVFQDDGTHDVRAYITDSKNDAVTYAIAPRTPVSVAPSATPPTTPTQEPSRLFASATTTLAEVPAVTAEVGRRVAARITPTAESAARRIEQFRDRLLQPSTQTQTTSLSTNDSANGAQNTTATKKEALSRFVSTAKHIFNTSELPLWKKALGIILSGLALLVRFWFIPLVLLVALAVWLLARGRRIR